MRDRRACPCRIETTRFSGARQTLCAALLGIAWLLAPGPAAVAQDDAAPSETASTAEPAPESDPERVTVFAELDGVTSAPLGASSTRVDPQQSGMAPATVTELITTAPGVSENGQGGLFQVLSIRGVSRQRVMQLVSGVRVTSERRAGVSSSFIDPLLMGSIEVLQGPSTTFYGSGALGGVVQSFPKRFGPPRLETGYDSNGDQSYVVAGSGGKHWSVGIAHRRGNDAEAADGTRLNSQFEQISAVIRLDWERDGLSYGLLAIPSYGEDIGKANTDFPGRTTDYPRERHQLFKFSIRSDDRWRFESFVHAHDLETEVFQPDVQRSRVFNDTVDFGARWEGQRDLAGRTRLRFGLDGFARDGVDAREIREFLDPLNPAPPLVERPLDGGKETEAGAFGVVRGPWGRATWETGLRLSWQDQNNAGSSGNDRSALNGFAGITRPVGNHWEVQGSLSSGLRFPSLSELFFSGTTGRGTVIGNPDLNDERALSVEASARWRSERLLVQGVLYHTRIDDYIDREEIQPDLLTFVNLTSGTIAGLELQVMQILSDSWTWRWGGHLIDGEDSAGRPLADIPTNEAFVGATYRSGGWTYDARLGLRDSKDDPGGPSCVAPVPVCSEKMIPSAELLSASVRYHFSPRWAVSLSGANLLDEDYFRSADRKAPPAPGRSAAIRLIWQAD